MFRSTLVAQGISGLHSHIRKAHPHCISTTRVRQQAGRLMRPPPDYLFVDVNNILYSFSGKSEREFCSSLFFSLDNMLSNVGCPLHCLFLGIDGPGPYSKIPLQQKRRLTAWRGQNFNDPVLAGSVNPLDFTPGTQLLVRVAEALQHYCAVRMTSPLSARETQAPLHKLLKSIVSSVDVPGEGEFKIFQFLRSVSTDFSSREEGAFPQTAIVSSDSDLVLFSLRAGYYLGRIDIWMNSNSFLPRSPCTVYSITKLRREIISGVLSQESRTTVACQQIIDDWVLLNLLRGSDLLPGLKEFNFERTWEKYAAHRGALTIWNEQTKSVDLLALTKVLVASTRVFTSPFAADDGQPAYHRLPIQDLFRSIMTYAGIKWKVHTNADTATTSSGQHAELLLDGAHYVVLALPPSAQLQSTANVTKKLLALALQKIHHDADGLVAQRLRATLSPAAFAATWSKIEEALQRLSATLPATEADRAAATPGGDDSDDSSSALLGKQTPTTQLIEQYAAALAWNMEYLRGRCVDWGFAYPSPQAPTITKEAVAPLLRRKTNKLDRPLHRQHKRPPLDPLMHALLVLPREIIEASYDKQLGVLRLLDDTSPITDILPPRNMQTMFETNQFIKSLPPLPTCIARVQEACQPVLDSARLSPMQSAVILRSSQAIQAPYSPPDILKPPSPMVPPPACSPLPDSRIEVVPLAIDPTVDFA